MLIPVPHRIGHVAGRFDDFVSGDPVFFGKKRVVQDDLLFQRRQFVGRHAGELEDVAARHVIGIEAQLVGTDHFHPVESPRHFVADDRRACGDAVDNSLVHQFRDQRRHAFVDIWTAAASNDDLAAVLLDLDHLFRGLFDAGLRALVLTLKKSFQQFSVNRCHNAPSSLTFTDVFPENSRYENR